MGLHDAGDRVRYFSRSVFPGNLALAAVPLTPLPTALGTHHHVLQNQLSASYNLTSRRL